MKHLNELKITIDWISFVSSDEHGMLDFQNRLESFLKGKFEYVYNCKSYENGGTAADRKNDLEKWKIYSRQELFGLSIKGPRANRVAETFLFGKEDICSYGEIKLNRLDLKITYEDALCGKKMFSLKQIHKRVEEFRLDQTEHEKTRPRPRAVTLFKSKANRTLNIGSRKNAVFSRFCYGEKGSYLELEIKGYQRKTLYDYYKKKNLKKLEQHILDLFVDACEGFVNNPLVNVLKSHIKKIRERSEILEEEIKQDEIPPELWVFEKESFLGENYSIQKSFKKPGIPFLFKEDLFKNTLGDSKLFVITAALLHIYAENVLKKLSYKEYSAKLTCWQEGLTPKTNKEIDLEGNDYRKIVFTPEDIGDFLGKPVTTQLNTKILKTLEFLHKFEMKTLSSPEKNVQVLKYLYAIPDFHVQRDGKKQLKFQATVSNLFFAGLFYNGQEIRTNQLKEFILHLKRTPLKNKPWKRIYHLFVEILIKILKNENTIVLSKLLSFPKLRSERRMFVESFLQCLFFFTKKKIINEITIGNKKVLLLGEKEKKTILELIVKSRKKEITLSWLEPDISLSGTKAPSLDLLTTV